MDERDFEICGVKPVEEKWVSDFIARVKNAINPQRIYLFGSRSLNEHLTWSDYDIAIISKDFDQTPPAERMYEMLNLWEGERPLEVFCFTPEEFGRNTTLMEEIRKGRILL